MPDPAAPRTVRVPTPSWDLYLRAALPPIINDAFKRARATEGDLPDCGPFVDALLSLLQRSDPAAEAKLALVDGFLTWLKSTEDEEARGLDLLRQVKRLAFPAPGQRGDG